MLAPMLRRIAAVVVVTLAALASPVSAALREARIPLHDGKLRSADLFALLSRELHLPECRMSCGDIDLTGLNGSNFVAAVNESLGEGCHVSLSGDALVVQVDADKLPADVRSAKRCARIFTAVASPEATARQRASYGLWIPKTIDTSRPLVVLIHGLDCDRLNWAPMMELLRREGRQSAIFVYPSDQPIADSAKELGDRLLELRLSVPTVSFDFICHSMGGLVARKYVESEIYRGGVERMILLGTPSRGAKMARYRFALEVQEHFWLWQHEPDWSPTWMITDGLGEAGGDLKPGSDFLQGLNALPRRSGVKYTIIAGNQHPAREMTATTIAGTADLIPRRASQWWGFRQTKAALEDKAGRMRQSGKSDGPVDVKSCRLRGVDDFVVISCDHEGLYASVDGSPPASWDVIRDRLSH
jgi:pimeloyl-ACP methyl ester carboxylesterase